MPGEINKTPAEASEIGSSSPKDKKGSRPRRQRSLVRMRKKEEPAERDTPETAVHGSGSGGIKGPRVPTGGAEDDPGKEEGNHRRREFPGHRHTPRVSVEPYRNLPDVNTSVKSLGEAVVKDAVLVGSGAREAAFGSKAVPRRDTDLAVSPGMYHYLREQRHGNKPVWQEIQLPNGRQGLQQGEFKAGVNWGPEEEFTTEALRESGWTTNEGIRVAGLPHVYYYEQKRSLDPHDPAVAGRAERELKLIRERLLAGPLPARVMPIEVEFARSCLPESLREAPEARLAVSVAANGLHIVEVFYGTDERANLVSGKQELPQYRVRAYSHNGSHTSKGMRRGQIHMNHVNSRDLEAGRTPRFGDRERLEALVAFAYHDVIIGNGIESYDPIDFDERATAALAADHLDFAGMTGNDLAGRVMDAIEDTGFDLRTGKPKTGRNDLGRTSAGADKQYVSEPGAVEDSFRFILEEMLSQRGAGIYHRILGRVAQEQGIILGPKPEDALGFIDVHAEAKGSDKSDSPIMRSVLGNGLLENARRFTDPRTGHEFPPGWTGDHPVMRRYHALTERRLGRRLATGEINAVEAYEEAKEHTRRMRERFPDSFDGTPV